MDDQTLLARYVATRDALAFEELAKRYAVLVRSVCVRVLGNAHDAEDVAQECFLELARHAGEVHSSVPGWLHRAATSRSLNVLRSRMRRRVRERQVGLVSGTSTPEVEVTANELKSIIEGSLTELPDELRSPMLLHFFKGRSQREVALELGVNQSTISRRMRDALDLLRERLAQSGYVVTAPAIMVFLQQPAVTAAESHLTEISTVAAAGKSVGTVSLYGCLKSTVLTLLPILFSLVLGGWISLFGAIVLLFYVAQFRPRWISELCSSVGMKGVYDAPTFCLSRWSWREPPVYWRQELIACLVKSVWFLVLAVAFVWGTDHAPGGIVVLALMVASGFLIQSVRLINRVRAISPQSLPFRKTLLENWRSETWTALVQSGQQPVDAHESSAVIVWFDALQLLAIGVAAVGTAMFAMFGTGTNLQLPVLILMVSIGPGMALRGLSAVLQGIRRPRSGLVTEEAFHERTLPHRGTRVLLRTGIAVVAGLTTWIVWNPASVRGLSLSLAAIQTAMLGWLFYRVAAHCRNNELRLVRQAALLLLIACFVLNSGVCVANWWP